MLLQRIGGFQITHIGVMRAAFPLRKATQELCEPPLGESRMNARLK
jgi:hypothetical protein